MFKKELPFKTYGYNSVIEFVSDLPHIILVKRPHPKGDWHLHPVASSNEGNILVSHSTYSFGHINPITVIGRSNRPTSSCCGVRQFLNNFIRVSSTAVLA